MTLPGKLIRGTVRPDRHSLARFASLRWAALPIIDRRWTAPLSAAALGFGLFVGVAIGPGAQGTKGASGPLTVQVPESTAPQDAPPPQAGDSGEAGGDQGGQSGSTGGGASPSASPPPPTTTPSSPSTVTPPVSPSVTPIPTTSTGGTGTSSTTTTTTEPAEDPTSELKGTVVHINPYADSYTIAADGTLIAIHSHRPPNLGRSIDVEAQQLANDTYVEAGNRREHGSSGQVSFGGTVSFSDPNTDVYSVSAPGVSLLVRGTDGHVPRLGDGVEVRARISDSPEPLPVRDAGEQGCGRPPALPKPPGKALEQVSLRITEGDRAATTDVEAIVEGVCSDRSKLIVTADDLRESGRDIALAVPDGIKLGKIDTGNVLRMTADIRDGGSLELSTLAGDQDGHAADDPDLVQP